MDRQRDNGRTYQKEKTVQAKATRRGKHMVYTEIRSPPNFYREAAISNSRIQGETGGIMLRN